MNDAFGDFRPEGVKRSASALISGAACSLGYSIDSITPPVLSRARLAATPQILHGNRGTAPNVAAQAA